jgi:Zn-dependent protease with chaperone function
MAASRAADSKRRPHFLKVFALPVLWLFLVPAATLGFVAYGNADMDSMFLSAVQDQLAKAKDMSEADRTASLAFFREWPPSRICAEGSPSPDHARYQRSACTRWGVHWQFLTAQRVALACLALGLFAVVGAAALGFIAFSSRKAQYWSFMLGWRRLTAVCGIELIAQGALVVWLSFWVTALLFDLYVIKLIILAGILALSAAGLALLALFKSPPEPAPQDAVEVLEQDAPSLWARLRELAAKVGTEPPAHLVAGIDDNFFVTEKGLRLTTGELQGRTLYVSLPLLRTLEPSEAEAVLCHELAHFQGGDTAQGARLYPMLTRYDAYMGELTESVTLPAYYLLRMYRAIFELALKKESRERELVADRVAAQQTSADDAGRALLKVTGYSSFRSHTERTLFAQRSKHEERIDLKERIALGLGAFALSPHFADELAATRTPHPFDSHPPLAERLQTLSCRVTMQDAPALLQAPPSRTWADEIATAERIEKTLWDEYEARFKAHHERSLAYRYLPASDEERALVERYFPALTFELPKGRTLRMTHQAMEVPRHAVSPLPFAWITKAQVHSGNFQRLLRVDYRSPDTGKKGVLKLNLRELKKQAPAFEAAFSAYWQRDQMARAAVREQAAAHTPSAMSA